MVILKNVRHSVIGKIVIQFSIETHRWNTHICMLSRSSASWILIYHLFVVLNSKSSRNWRLLRIFIQIMPHLHPSKVMCGDREAPSCPRCSSDILEFEHLPQRSSKRTTNQASPETEMQSMTQDSIICEWAERIQFLWIGEGNRIHVGFGSSY